MKYSFVSFLGTDSFLPGVIALNNSLKKHNQTYPLLVLTTDLVSAASIRALDVIGIAHKYVNRIQNPNHLEDDSRNFRHMYTKLRIFELDEFDKVVYIDADMLVCRNIEELFDCPHMSAVAAGSLNPAFKDWVDLNAGFLIVEPDKKLAEEMYALVDSTPSNDGSDQGFLHSFYKDWSKDEHLHLSHKYNAPVSELSVYVKQGFFRFNYKNGVLDTDISILHYWGGDKPWNHDGRKLSIRSPRIEDHAYILWWDVYKPELRKARNRYYFVNAVRRKFLSLFKH